MNERMMILKMLSEGKITLEEADSLLVALGITDVNLNLDINAQIKNEEPADSKSKVSVGLTEEEEEELEEELEQIEEEIEELDDELEEIDDEFEEQIEDLKDRSDDEEKLAPEQKEEIEQKLNEIRQKRRERKEKIKARRKELKEELQQKKKKYKKHTRISLDINEGLDEISKGFQELKKNFQGEGMEEIKLTVKDIASQINGGMKELRDNLNEGTKEVRKAFKGKDLKQMFSNFFNSIGFGNFANITLEEEVNGTLDSTQGPIEIDLKTFNGRIEVVGTDDEDYKLHLTYQIHADSEEEAQVVKEQMATITQTPTLLKLETHRHGFGGVKVKLYVPKKIAGEFKLKTSNGRICIMGIKGNGHLDLTSSNGRLELTDLRVAKLKGRTSNGRIECKDFAAEDMEVQTSNGSIYLDGLCDQIHARTSNGTITVIPSVIEKGNFDLNTSNGRIKVEVCDPEVGLDIDTSTTMGSITLDVPDLVYQKQLDKNMRKEYQAQSENYVGKEKRIQIQAVTSMGSIYIIQNKE